MYSYCMAVCITFSVYISHNIKYPEKCKARRDTAYTAKNDNVNLSR